MLSDALLSAGVDLKEEESLLSRSLYGAGSGAARSSATFTTGAGGGLGSSAIGGTAGDSSSGTGGTGAAVLPSLLDRIYQYQQTHQQVPFLDPGRLQYILDSHAHDIGLSLSKDSREVDAIMTLISYACQEWVSDIVTTSLVMSRHRRRSRNNAHSEVSRALRGIAQKDKDEDEKRLIRKAQIIGENEENGDASGKGASGSGAASSKKERAGADDDGNDEGTKTRGRGRGTQPDEINYSAANATVQMMTLGSKRKYSWMTEGAGAGAGAGGAGGAGPGASMRGTGVGLRSDNTVRYREVREEQGLVIRDLMMALEHQRAGVLGTIMKGYAKMRY